MVMTPWGDVLRKPTATVDNGGALLVESDAVRQHRHQFRTRATDLDCVACIGIVQGCSQGVGWAVYHDLFRLVSEVIVNKINDGVDTLDHLIELIRGQDGVWAKSLSKNCGVRYHGATSEVSLTEHAHERYANLHVGIVGVA
jgi:hypothetical protein